MSNCPRCKIMLIKFSLKISRMMVIGSNAKMLTRMAVVSFRVNCVSSAFAAWCVNEGKSAVVSAPEISNAGKDVMVNA